MKKENLKDEKIQTKIADKAESQTLQECCEQDCKEKSHEPSWWACALEYLSQSIDCEYVDSCLVSYQYSRLIDGKWSPWLPYSSYIHFTSSKVDLKSIILGSLDNLEVGTYRFKLLSLFKYDDFWYLSSFYDIGWVVDFILEINVFDTNGCKGFNVCNCYLIQELYN